MITTNSKILERITIPSDYSEIRTNLQNEDEILVTAIVSTYNSEKFFNGCINDLLNQSLYKKGQLEILVIDSNSQQSEGKQLEDFEKLYKNITYVRTKERETLYAAWNRAIELAAGVLLTNANTDDRHNPNALEVLAAALTGSPDAVLAYGDLIVTKKENETFQCCSIENYIEYPDFNPINQIHFGQCGPQPMWRKALHAQYGMFAEGFEICADYEWWLRLSRKEKFIHVPRLLGLYLESPTSIEHREPNKSKFETDVIRNFYAAVSNIKLDHQKYRNNAIQNFYSRSHILRESEFLLTLVCVTSSLEDLQFLIAKLHSELAQVKIELIIVHSFLFDNVGQLLKYSDRIKIRAVRINESLSHEVAFAFGSLHATTPCVGYLSEKLKLDDPKVIQINRKLTNEAQQILIIGESNETLEYSFFQSEIFESLKHSYSVSDFEHFMQALQNKLKSS